MVTGSSDIMQLFLDVCHAADLVDEPIGEPGYIFDTLLYQFSILSRYTGSNAAAEMP